LIGGSNYLTAPEEEQKQMFLGWRKVINSFGSRVEFSLSFNNRNINENDFKESVLLKEVGDNFDHLRRKMNSIIVNRMIDGRNSIQKDKYLTVAIHTESPAKAAATFHRMETGLDDSFKKTGSSFTIISLEERLEILYGIYNDPSEHFITSSRVFDNEGKIKEIRSFDFDHMRSMGLTINDLISPSSIQIERDKLRFGDKLVRVLSVVQMPSQMMDEFMTNVTDMPFNCLTTITFKPMDAKTAEALVSKNLSLVRDQKTKQIRTGQKAGIYDDSYINPDLLDREAEALALRDDMHERDEKLFETTFTIAIFADDEKHLDQYTESLVTEYKKASVIVNTMLNQQEEGFNTTLPLCFNQVYAKRTLKSSSAAIMLPFSNLELNDPGGINYSCNLLSKNLIVYDRLTSNNYNGFILGTPGSGKSFTAKVEMLNVFLRSNADIVVIDPEDEYTALATLLGGEVINIAPGGENHINPMEIVSNYEFGKEENNPVYAKADFILRLCECINKNPFGVNPIQETIVDECVHQLFAPFMASDGRLKLIPPDQMPTLTDLQRMLAERKEREAQELAIALRLYTGSGSLNVFGCKTNVNTHSRFVVYQIRDVGDRLKSLAMLTILDHIWNQIVTNQKIGKATWFYIDEIYLLFQNEYSASFLNELFRRARKYLGVPTGITQNVSPLLESPTARDMLQNCNFIQILAQAGPDRDRLQEILNLSDAQIDYITSSPKGQGLLYTGKKAVVPFYSTFPKDNDIYKALTSDLREIKAFEASEKRERARREKEAKSFESFSTNE
jgi:type IV secretory pathway VirB4 component